MLRRLLVGLILAPRVLHAQTTLAAGVAEAGTGRPIPNAEVVVVDLARVARTDWLGQAAIAKLPAGRHRVRVRKQGYAAADIELQFQGDTLGATFMLEPSPPSLDTVRVTARAVPSPLREFDQRRVQGIGRFLTDSVLQKQGDREFVFVATTHFPGLQPRSDQHGKWHIVSTRGSCGAEPTRMEKANETAEGPIIVRGLRIQPAALGSCGASSTCPVKVYLDRMELTQDDLDIVRTWDLSGVEYYTGANMPAQYRVAGTACGLILLWSKW